MHYRAVLTLLVCIVFVLLPPGGSASAGEKPVRHRASAPATAIHVVPPGSERGFQMPNLVSHRPARSTPQGLRVADSALAPATIDPAQDGVADNSAADGSPFGFQGLPGTHSRSYADLGRITGYYQRATWSPAQGPVVFRYLGSIMSSAGTAQAAQQDSVLHQLQPAFGAQVTPCAIDASHNVANCNVVGFQGKQGSTTVDVQDVAWAVGSCLVETETEYPASLASDTATVNQIEAALSKITNAAAALAGQLCADQGGPPVAPTPTNTSVPPGAPTKTPTQTPVPTVHPTSTQTAVPSPTPTSTAVSSTATPTPTATKNSTGGKPARLPVSILAAHVEKNGASSDPNRSSLARVTKGQPILLAIYVQVRKAAIQGEALTFSFGVWKGSTPVLSKIVSEVVGSSLPAELREIASVQFAKKGKYKFTAGVRYQGRSTRQSTTFTVVAAAKKAGH